MFTNLPTPPPQPPWEGMHPLVVHFPIALLLFAAVFVVLAMIVPKRGWWFSVSALLVLLGGTAGAYVSVSTGIAARDKVEEGEDEMFEVMQQHEDQMIQARNVFVALTIVYAGLVVLPLLASSLRSLKFAMPANLVFLAALMGANLLMASGAHLGGRLVHQYGVKSALAPEAGAAATEAQEETPAAEEIEEASATEDKKEAPATEPKPETPAPDPAKDGAAKEAKEL